MLERLYPTRLSDVASYAAQKNCHPDEATDRFLYYAVLDSVACHPCFRGKLVLRGAGALRYFHGLERPTRDADLIWREFPPKHSAAQAAEVVSCVRQALSAGLRRHFADFESRKQDLLTRVKVQVSPWEMNPPYTELALAPNGHAMLGVCDLEFLVAQKLLAILSMAMRDRDRPQDVADLGLILRRHGKNLDQPKLARCVHEDRCRRLGKLGTALTDNIYRRLRLTYDQEAGGTFRSLLPFDAGWKAVVSLSASVGIPCQVTTP